jgi:hypothetical protein
VIVCLRTVAVPPEWRERYLAWIAAGREIRQQHGILAELVCEPTDGGDTIVITGGTGRHAPTRPGRTLAMRAQRRRQLLIATTMAAVARAAMSPRCRT